MQKKRYALVIDSRKCINCKACVVACRAENQVPLGHSRNWINEEHRGAWPKLMASFEPEQCHHCANPSCARFFREDKGVVEKCTFCVHRVDRGEPPACVETCPSKARVFGDINDPNGKIHELLETRNYRTKNPQTGNGPQIYYLL